MKYLLMIHSDPSAYASIAPGDFGVMMAAYQALNTELAETGELVAGDALQGVEMATTVRVRDDRANVTDGPFIETKEVIGGYYVIDVADLDRAIAIASRIPDARLGGVEIRPIRSIPG